MNKVKIIGAGSIGNHMANACREFGWSVLLCDNDPEALLRTKNDIYPERYGRWDDGIKLSTMEDSPKDNYDIIIIGTPPQTHIDIAIDTIKYDNPKLLMIEKPLSTPDLNRCDEFYSIKENSKTIVTVGYNHLLGPNTIEAEKLLSEKIVGDILHIESTFNEYWGGIFLAHPWLDGPQDSYLGFWKKGGGASGEHSHAANLLIHFLRFLNKGRINEVDAFMDIVQDGIMDYDKICKINVKTVSGFMGTISQDVITKPTQKKIRFQGSDGFLEWHMGYHKDTHAIIYQIGNEDIKEILLPSTRRDDFILEVQHLDDLLTGKVKIATSPVNVDRGLDTMLLLSAAHLSNSKKRRVSISNKDYNQNTFEVL